MNPEQFPSSPAPELAHDLHERLSELLPPAPEIARARQDFASTLNRVRELFPNPKQREMIEIAAGMIDWIYFGDIGEPLPIGLVTVVDDDKGTVRLEIDIRFISYNDLYCAHRLLLENRPTSNILPATFPIEQLDRLKEPLRALLEQSDGYKLVRSFAVPKPEQPAAKALPPWLRAVRESQILAEVRQRYGIHGSTPLAKRTPPDFAYRRGLFHLDDETLPDLFRQTHDTLDPLEKLRRYFRPILIELMQREAEDLGEPGTVTNFVIDDDFDYIPLNGKEKMSIYLANKNILDVHLQALRTPG